METAAKQKWVPPSVRRKMEEEAARREQEKDVEEERDVEEEASQAVDAERMDASPRASDESFAGSSLKNDGLSVPSVGVGEITEDEIKADIFSAVWPRSLILDPQCRCGVLRDRVRFALIASVPMASLVEGRLPARPTVIAISGEEQRHVSRFFRSWRAERRDWQVIIPLRPEDIDAPYLYEEPDIIVRLMERILNDTLTVQDEEDALVPFGVEGSKFHIVGTSNGGATALKISSLRPDLTASLSMVTGFVPDGTDLQPLQAVPSIRMYAGDQDQCGHDKALSKLHDDLAVVGIESEITIFPAIDHFKIGEHIDQDEFWRGLEMARPGQICS